MPLTMTPIKVSRKNGARNFKKYHHPRTPKNFKNTIDNDTYQSIKEKMSKKFKEIPITTPQKLDQKISRMPLSPNQTREPIVGKYFKRPIYITPHLFKLQNLNPSIFINGTFHVQTKFTLFFYSLGFCKSSNSSLGLRFCRPSSSADRVTLSILYS